MVMAGQWVLQTTFYCNDSSHGVTNGTRNLFIYHKTEHTF